MSKDDAADGAYAVAAAVLFSAIAVVIAVAGVAAGFFWAGTGSSERALECVESGGDPSMCRKAAGVSE